MKQNKKEKKTVTLFHVYILLLAFRRPLDTMYIAVFPRSGRDAGETNTDIQRNLN